MSNVHDLVRIHAVASAMARPEVAGHSLAASLGPATDPLGRGDQWIVERPTVAGVHSIVVVASPENGTPAPPSLAVFGFVAGAGPHLHEVEEVFGAGVVVEPLEWEPWRLVYDGPSSDAASVTIVVSTDAVTGDERDPLVTEIALRRDQR